MKGNIKKKVIIIIGLAIICVLLVFVLQKKEKKLKDYGGMPAAASDSTSVSETASEIEKQQEMEEIKKRVLQDNPDVTESDLSSDSDYYAEYYDGGE